MDPLTFPAGDYSIRTRGSQVEIAPLDRELTREEVAAQLGRTARSIDLYRNLPAGPLKLKSRRAGGRIFIKESELQRWLIIFDKLSDEDPLSDRPRKKRRTRLAINGRRKIRANAETAPSLSGVA